MENQSLRLGVSDFIALTNQVLDGAYPSIEIEGEVASFKVNQGKFIFFDLKDAESSIGCFMMVFALRIPIEDGMKVIVRATPKLTKWGKFSLTVQSIRPSGEGSLKKSFELLKAKLAKEGLFSTDRKRILPYMPQKIAIISSTQAAGYIDFVKIVEQRWSGLDIQVAHVQVQGESAPDQMIRALEYFNQQSELADVVVLLRGGGSADDLRAFNDELLVRAIAASRIPTLTGIGHEIDESLVDLAADVSASTPSNAAERLVPDRVMVQQQVRGSLRLIWRHMDEVAESSQNHVQSQLERIVRMIDQQHLNTVESLRAIRSHLAAYDPQRVLERGYAITRGEMEIGKSITIEQARNIITAEVTNVTKK